LSRLDGISHGQRPFHDEEISEFPITHIVILAGRHPRYNFGKPAAVLPAHTPEQSCEHYW